MHSLSFHLQHVEMEIGEKQASRIWARFQFPDPPPPRCRVLGDSGSPPDSLAVTLTVPCYWPCWANPFSCFKSKPLAEVENNISFIFICAALCWGLNSAHPRGFPLASLREPFSVIQGFGLVFQWVLGVGSPKSIFSPKLCPHLPPLCEEKGRPQTSSMAFCRKQMPYFNCMCIFPRILCYKTYSSIPPPCIMVSMMNASSQWSFQCENFPGG